MAELVQLVGWACPWCERDEAQCQAYPCREELRERRRDHMADATLVELGRLVQATLRGAMQ